MIDQSLSSISEGSAKIFKDEFTFFNPAQKLNRDLSVAVIRECFRGKPNVRILDAMSATGLRGIRYFNEIPNAKVFMNDISEEAISIINSNISCNSIDSSLVANEENLLNISSNRYENKKIIVTKADCKVICSLTPHYFDVIDIDPFGSCAQYVDCALGSIKHNGVLCFTATDKAALCSNVDKCFVKYTTTIYKNFAKNEMAMRTLLSLVSRHASKFGASIEVLCSFSVDFYVRVFIKVIKRHPKKVLEDNSFYHICKCHNFLEANKSSNICNICQSDMKMCGLFWNRSLCNKDLINQLLNTTEEKGNERMVGLLRLISQELEVPFYYEISKLCSLYKTSPPKQRCLMNALANLGFQCSFTHCCLDSVKTDTPINVLIDMLKKKMPDYDKLIASNSCIDALYERNYYKGLISSGIGPGSLPKNKD